MAFIDSDGLFVKWAAQCDLPKECRRMVIDLAVDDVVMVYYECYADEDVLKLLPPVGARKQRAKRSWWGHLKCRLGFHEWRGVVRARCRRCGRGYGVR